MQGSVGEEQKENQVDLRGHGDGCLGRTGGRREENMCWIVLGSRVNCLAGGLEMRCKGERRVEKDFQVLKLSSLVNHGAIFGMGGLYEETRVLFGLLIGLDVN